ncbi:hypothetical protein LIER_15414 [Lithospermum erythrorhizon]|uniref:Uncharacterized protein n=1 Tax=Lithospermum erythrorhizon TaxID=34254 RepID=A0AAV3Q496_LITER
MGVPENCASLEEKTHSTLLLSLEDKIITEVSELEIATTLWAKMETGCGSLELLRATPLTTRTTSSQIPALAASSSRRPPLSKVVRANIDRCCSELSERDLVSLRARYGIPSSVTMRCPKATERANAPPPGLRSIFVVALENGMCLLDHPCVGEVFSMAGLGLGVANPDSSPDVVRSYFLKSTLGHQSRLGHDLDQVLMETCSMNWIDRDLAKSRRAEF